MPTSDAEHHADLLFQLQAALAREELLRCELERERHRHRQAREDIRNLEKIRELLHERIRTLTNTPAATPPPAPRLLRTVTTDNKLHLRGRAPTDPDRLARGICQHPPCQRPTRTIGGRYCSQGCSIKHRWTLQQERTTRDADAQSFA